VREEPWVRLDGVLERRAVDLDGVGNSRARERAREDHRAHDEVVGQCDVRPNALDHVAHRGHVRTEVGVELGLGERLEGTGLDSLVAVGDVDGEQAADLRPVHRRPHGHPPLPHAQRPVVPRSLRVDPRELQRGAVLAQQVQLVAAPDEGSGELGVVDVRSRSAQEVAVEDEDLHNGSLPALCRGSHCYDPAR
jgi:hypothetical protein